VTARVLLIDDDPAILSIVASRLARSGRYSVHVARGGREGLKQVERLAPEVVVCDVQMPDLDGRALAAAAAENPASAGIPFIFLSSIDSEEPDRRMDRWPVVSKAAAPGRLEQEIETALSEGRRHTDTTP
jgi:putative two-component system response regulator